MRGQSEAAWEQALKELGIEIIPAYSPQARGRSEWRLGTGARLAVEFNMPKQANQGKGFFPGTSPMD